MIDPPARASADGPIVAVLVLGLAFLGAELYLPSIGQPHVWTTIGVVYLLFGVVLGIRRLQGRRPTVALLAGVAVLGGLAVVAITLRLLALDAGFAEDWLFEFILSPRLLVPSLVAFLPAARFAPPGLTRFVLALLGAMPFLFAFYVVHGTIEYAEVGMGPLVFYAAVGLAASYPLAAALSRYRPDPI